MRLIRVQEIAYGRKFIDQDNQVEAVGVTGFGSPAKFVQLTECTAVMVTR